MHGALAETLPVFDTVIVAIRDPVLLVHAIPQGPSAIRALYQPGENLCRAVFPLPAAAGYLLLYPVKNFLADDSLMGIFHPIPVLRWLVYSLFTLKRYGSLFVVYAVADVCFIL